MAVADVPAWAGAAFGGFVLAVLVLDLFVLHRRARETSLKEAATWSAVWVSVGLGFGGLLWWWQGGGTAEAYLAGYLIEKSLSVNNILVFAFIFSALQIPPRYQQRVLMLGILAALVMRGAFIAGGIALLENLHPVIYVFGALLLYAAIKMLRGGSHPQPQRTIVLRGLRRILPASDRLHGQRFLVREGGRVLATPLLLALIMIETTDVIFAVDSIPAILAVTTDTFVVFTSNVLALLGMRALYFLLAGATARVRYLRPGLAVILVAVAAKMLLADLYEFPVWASPAFIVAVLAVTAAMSLRDLVLRRRGGPGQQPGQAARAQITKTRTGPGGPGDPQASAAGSLGEFQQGMQVPGREQGGDPGHQDDHRAGHEEDGLAPRWCGEQGGDAAGHWPGPGQRHPRGAGPDDPENHPGGPAAPGSGEPRPGEQGDLADGLGNQPAVAGHGGGVLVGPAFHGVVDRAGHRDEERIGRGG